MQRTCRLASGAALGLRPLLPTDGQVVRVDLPGQVSGRFDWRRQTRLDFVVDKSGISVRQDGRLVGSKRFSDGYSVSPPAAGKLRTSVCRGIFGSCPKGTTVTFSGL